MQNGEEKSNNTNPKQYGKKEQRETKKTKKRQGKTIAYSRKKGKYLSNQAKNPIHRHMKKKKGKIYDEKYENETARPVIAVDT